MGPRFPHSTVLISNIKPLIYKHSLWARDLQPTMGVVINICTSLCQLHKFKTVLLKHLRHSTCVESNYFPKIFPTDVPLHLNTYLQDSVDQNSSNWYISVHWVKKRETFWSIFLISVFVPKTVFGISKISHMVLDKHYIWCAPCTDSEFNERWHCSLSMTVAATSNLGSWMS